MTASGTVNYDRQGSGLGLVDKLVIEWETTSGGAFSQQFSMHGEIVGVNFIPSVTIAPDANYDVSLLEVMSNDVLNAVNLLGTFGDNLSATVPLRCVPYNATSLAKHCVYGMLQLDITGAGNSNGGIVEILYRR